jgi:ankyrin repeat protein
MPRRFGQRRVCERSKKIEFCGISFLFMHLSSIPRFNVWYAPCLYTPLALTLFSERRILSSWLSCTAEMPSKSKQCARATDNVDDDDNGEMVAERRAQDHQKSSSSSSSSSCGIAATDDIISSPSPSVESTEKELVIDLYYACNEDDKLITWLVLREDLDELRRLGQQGIRVESAYPLTLCGSNKSPVRILTCLIYELGADVNQARADGVTALLIAAQEGNLEVVRCLVGEHGATVGQVANDGNFPLLSASRSEHLDILCYLVDHRADVDQTKEEDGHTCLFEACVWGRIDVVKCLVEVLHADVNKEDTNGNTPMHAAARFGHVEVVRCLMNAGAINTQANFAAAVHNGHLEMLQYLVQEFGADVNQEMQPVHKAPLFFAAKGGDLDMVRCLVALLADVNQRDENGHTAAEVAAAFGHTEVLRFLINSGADGKTAMLFAVGRGQVDTVRCLVKEFGADINQDMHLAQMAPLLFTATEGDVDMVRCLVELGASIEIMDGYGNTALLLSAGRGHYATVQLLLEEAGADINAIVDDGDTVWDLLTAHIENGAADAAGEANATALTSLLRVLVLREDPPLALTALLLRTSTRVVQEGARLRARLPAYLVQRRALLDAHCPLLPPLCDVVYGYMDLTTEEAWATGIGAAPNITLPSLLILHEAEGIHRLLLEAVPCLI